MTIHPHTPFTAVPGALLAQPVRPLHLIPRIRPLGGFLAIAAFFAGDLTAQEATTSGSATRLPTVVVTETADPLTAPSESTAAAELDEIAGNTSIIKQSGVNRGRVATAADVLKYQPGVYAQSAAGNDALRISIRGSGINRGPGSFREGILFLFDGLPVTGPGGTPFELFEPLGLNYTEVLRGGNAFKYGALALGGAINYVTQTGYEASPAQVRGEAGSFGYYKGQISSGLVVGPFDYYMEGTGSYRSGFQDHSISYSSHVAANVGYQVTPNLETRFYFRFGYTNFQQPGQITGQAIKDDPTSANPANIAANASRLQPGSQWIANKTILTLPDSSTLEVGTVYHNYPIKIYGAEYSSWWLQDLSATVRYSRSDTIFGLQSNTQLAFFTTINVSGGVDDYQATPTKANNGDLLKSVNYDGSANYVWSLSNDLEVLPNLWLTTGAAFVYTQRNSNFTYPFRQDYAQGLYEFAPRLGLRYDINPNWQVYGNVSRTVEPADSWKYSGGSSASQLFNRNLQMQKAVTLEFGTRGEEGIFDWDLAYYYSWVRDELLTVQVAPGPPPVTTNSNASPTIHQGIELSLNTVIWDWAPKADAGDKKTVAAGDPEPNRLTFRQAYTWSSFHFVSDSQFGHNQLPGLPEHFYQAELRYEHPSGVYLALMTQAASGYPVDYANTFDTSPYVTFGAEIGYRHPKKGLEAYVQFLNITNERYATSVSPIYDAAGKDAPVQSPGDGFGVYGGLSFAF